MNPTHLFDVEIRRFSSREVKERVRAFVSVSFVSAKAAGLIDLNASAQEGRVTSWEFKVPPSMPPPSRNKPLNKAILRETNG